jgi:hypothetical protein
MQIFLLVDASLLSPLEADDWVTFSPFTVYY